LSKLRDALQGHDWASLEMLFEAVIKEVWRCNWTPRLSKLRDALGAHDPVSLDMHLETEIEWTQKYTPSSAWASLEMDLQQSMMKGD